MARTTRTFVAIVVPGDKAEKLGRLQSLVATEIPGARWVAPAQLHLTLAFLGDVDDTELNRVCRAVQDVVSGSDAIELRLEGIGVFPDAQRPHTIWAGVVGPGIALLGSLQQAVAKGVSEIGYPPTDNRFTPHVTLGRLKPGKGRPSASVGAILRQYARWSAGSFVAGEVVTFASNPTPDGPSYTPLARAPLAEKKRPASA